MAQPLLQDAKNYDPHGLLGQPAPPQPPLHPMVTGGNYVPSPPPLPINNISMPSSEQTKGNIVYMSKISLLTIAFSLTLLGAFTFLSGFLLGTWFTTPVPPPYSSVMSSRETPALGLSYPEQPIVQQPRPSSQKNKVLQTFVEETNPAVSSAISEPIASNTPRYLSPLVTATQRAIGEEVGQRVQQEVGQQLGQYSPQPTSPENTLQHTPPYQLSTGEIHPPLPTFSPKGAPSLGSPGATSPLSADRGNELYTVQLGVYAAKDNAYALVNHLQGLNHTSHVTEGKASDGSNIYYVHSGLYNDYTTALEAATQFSSSQNIPGAIVVKVSPNHKSAS